MVSRTLGEPRAHTIQQVPGPDEAVAGVDCPSRLEKRAPYSKAGPRQVVVSARPLDWFWRQVGFCKQPGLGFGQNPENSALGQEEGSRSLGLGRDFPTLFSRKSQLSRYPADPPVLQGPKPLQVQHPSAALWVHAFPAQALGSFAGCCPLWSSHQACPPFSCLRSQDRPCHGLGL